MIFLFRILRNNIYLCTAATVSIIGLNEYLWPHENFGNAPLDLRPYLPFFLLGNLAALYYLKRDGLKLLFPKFVYEFFALLALLTVLVTIPAIWNFLTGENQPYYHFHTFFLFYGLAWFIFLYSFLNSSGFLEKILSSKLMRFIGLISFSAYLWHWFIINAIKEFVPTPPSVQVLLVFPVTLAASYLSFLIFERPFIVKKEKPIRLTVTVEQP